MSSSLRGRCPPLLSRLRRYTREDGAAATPSPEDRRPQRLHHWWEEHKTSTEEDDDDDDEEEGAVGVDSSGASPDRRLEPLPELEDPSFPPHRRVDRSELQNQSESGNQEKLRRIKEK